MKKLTSAYASTQHITCAEITIALLQDAMCHITEYGEKDFNRDKVEILKRSQNEGLSFFCRILPRLSKGLLAHLEGCPIGYPNFGKFRGCEYPSFMKGLFTVAYDHKSVNHSLAVGFIYQISNAFKKLKGPYPDDVLRSQMEDFISIDENLVHDFSEPDIDIIERASGFIEELFSPINQDNSILDDGIVPRPGPGATNDPVDHVDRYEIHTYYESLANFFNMDEYFYPCYQSFVWDIPRFKQIYSLKRAYPLARFKFVDKVVGKARGICIEQNEPQYFQQGVKSFLYKWIEKHPLTKGKINFKSQLVNRNLAMGSSVCRTYATLDMSDASDRISLDLVKRLFARVPYLQECLVSLATRAVDVSNYSNKTIIELRKYAPMGSGLCFPIMSLCHWALCRSIVYGSMQRSQFEDIYVYGDDIVVPSPCAQAIFDWLPRFGMKLNFDKSFVQSMFRESCGIHAYNGLDITPVYFKYTPCNISKNVDVSSVIANEALLYTQGKTHTASYLRRQLRVKLPYVGRSSSAIGWKRSIDDPLIAYSMRERGKVRWHCDLQQFQYKYSVFVQDTTIEKAFSAAYEDTPGLLRWYSVRPDENHDEETWYNAPMRRAVRWVSASQIYGKSVD